MQVTTDEVEVISRKPVKESAHPLNGVELCVYTYEEVFAQAVLYFKGDELAANAWINKYALKDSFGNIYELTPDDMHRRIASEIASIEEKYPNPFSNSLTIVYELPDDQEAELAIYDIIGQKVKVLVPFTTFQNAGVHTITLNPDEMSLSNGLYFLEFYTKEYRKTIKLIHAKEQ